MICIFFGKKSSAMWTNKFADANIAEGVDTCVRSEILDLRARSTIKSETIQTNVF